MTGQNEDFLLYMCFETDQQDEVCRSLVVRSSRLEVEKWKKENRDTETEDAKSASDVDESNLHESDDESREHFDLPYAELSNLMTRFQETMSSYRPLVSFGMILMPALRSHFIYSEMYKNAERHLEIVDKDHQFETYGIAEDQYPSVKTQFRRLREFDRGVTVLPGAILLSLVATFDSYIADTLRIMLRRKPERVIDSSKSIKVKGVLQMSSFDEVRGKVIEDEVEALMRGSHDEQIKYIKDKLDIKIRSHYEEWGEFVEIFERRNLIAHGNYVVNAHYMKNCNKHGFDVSVDRVGETLSLDERYLRRSSDRLLEFGLSLMFVLWLKHFKDSKDKAYESLNELTYELIKDGQSRVAAKLLDLALFKQAPSASDEVEKMMTVNLANAYKKSKNDAKAQEVIRQVDWSAARDEFQICVAALQGEIERFVELMPRVAQADLVRKSDFREWPVFDWVREERSVREKFQELYDEPIIDPSDEEKNDDQESGSATKKENAQTIH